jgi:hypothetical protein
MHPMEGMASLAEWAGKNTAYNLGFLGDKVAWSPQDGAKSALDIVNHVSWFVVGMTGYLNDGAWSDPAFQPATDLAGAQSLVEDSAAAYAAALRNLPPQRLGDTAELPFGSFPMARAVSMPVVDLIHHHGQIAYLQTLLGDQEMHFYEAGT